MTKEELHRFAAAGAVQKIEAIEQELARYHQEWPHLFASPTPPRLLKSVLERLDGVGFNGHRSPTATPTEETPAAPRRRRRAPKRKRVITEAHRRKLSRLMKQRHASGVFAKARAAKKRAANA